MPVLSPLVEHYCTYFDRNYLVQGLTLYRSLSRHTGPFTLWVLCFDDPTSEALANLHLPNLHPVSLQEFEEGDAPLLRARGSRSRVEYIFTCTPSWILYILRSDPLIERITYVDADLMFYSDPRPIFEEIAGKSILIIGHRFPERLRHMEVYGVFNVGLLVFGNDPGGNKCLEWWRERCLESCSDRPGQGKFADQKYLDDWPERFPGVAVLHHKGAGLAPWNWMNYRLEFRAGEATVDDQPLIFFHFQGFRIISPRFYIPGNIEYGPMPAHVRDYFYDGYAREIFETGKWVRGKLPSIEVAANRMISRNYPWWKLAKGLIQGQIRYIRA